MFDIWLGDAPLTLVVFLLAVLVVLPVQLLLCFKVKSRAARLLPAILLAGAALLLAGAGVVLGGWEGLGLVILAALTAFPLLACGAGWALWALVRLAGKGSRLAG